METEKKNLVDFICHSTGNNEQIKGLLQKNTDFDSYKLVYVYEGVCYVTIDKKCYEVSTGCSVLIFPECFFEINANNTAKYTWLEFSGIASAAILSRIEVSKKSPVLGKIDLDGFEFLFDIPDVTVRSNEPYLLYRFGGCLLMLLSYYIEKFPSKTMEADGYVTRACHYIDLHYSSPGFCVRDVVEALKIDRSYLYRLFKDKTGVSVSDYITRTRISKAEVLLSNASLSVKDVAYSVGFPDQMYFSRVFKKINGRTPTQFREMLVKKDANPQGNL